LSLTAASFASGTVAVTAAGTVAAAAAAGAGAGSSPGGGGGGSGGGGRRSVVCEGVSPRLGYFGEAQAQARTSAAVREHAILAVCFADRLQVAGG
jgi:hypothetical protein